MGFRDKLERLTTSPLPAGPSRTVLQELRARIQATVERTALTPQVLPARKAPDEALPLEEIETEHGRVLYRTRRYPRAHLSGRAQLGSGFDARADLLALLALDPELSARDPRDALFLDTETTGLSGGAGTVAFLVGLGAWETDGTFVVDQLLIRGLGEEAPMLERVRQRLERASMLVTFNGKSFDLPLLRNRFVLSRLSSPCEPPHLDLLHVARRVHAGRVRNGCRLVALESDLLGFERVDDVPSAEVGAHYLHYLRTGDAEWIRGVVEHNASDVVAMAALVGLYGEPTQPGLPPEDVARVARTMHRAGAGHLALETADVAIDRGASAEALRIRGTIHKARGDRTRALADFETLANTVDDPQARLELSKIYEHWMKSPERALGWAQLGTGERPEAAQKRLTRLARKAERSR